MEAWLYPSYRSLVREATGGTEGEAVPIARPMRDPEAWVDILNGADGPPILVAAPGTFEEGYPRLPAPDFDPLPRIPGSLRGKLRAGGITDPHEPLCGWWLPWRKDESTRMVILLSNEAHLVIHTDNWPYPRMRTDNANDSEDGARARTVRWAAHVLQETPGAFALNGSVESAYQDIEEAWNRSVEHDPIGTLLETQARRLSGTLDAITARPRRVLRTEHRLVKLQSVRRIDAKAVQWLTRQPGRTPAERAGVRQRIKAPRRYEILDTLENRVLRTFCTLTSREGKTWLADADDTRRRERIEVHVLRCERLGRMLRREGVREQIGTAQPNFVLRFDPHYHEIWDAWAALRRRSAAREHQWMWQGRTILQLLALRIRCRMNATRTGAWIAHMPVQAIHGGSADRGHYITAESLGAWYGREEGGKRIPIWRIAGEGHQGATGATGDDALPVGAVVGPVADSRVWWQGKSRAGETDGNDVTVGELPGHRRQSWDRAIDRTMNVGGKRRKVPPTTHETHEEVPGATVVLAVDINGWSDHAWIPVRGERRNAQVGYVGRELGARSILARRTPQDPWLLGAQALNMVRIAAWEEREVEKIDAIEAMAQTAQGPNEASKDALGKALWQMVDSTAREVERTVHLALVIPDGRLLGRDHRRTERLYEQIVAARPSRLSDSTVRLVWRSVAAVEAARVRRGRSPADGERYLVVNVNRRTFWTEIVWGPVCTRCGQRQTPHGAPHGCPPEAVRRGWQRAPVMDDCNDDEAWSATRVEETRATVRGVLSEGKWREQSRAIEMIAGGAAVETINLMHKTWADDGVWHGPVEVREPRRATATLPKRFAERIERMRADGLKETTIVIETPGGIAHTAQFAAAVRKATGRGHENVTGVDVAKAAASLAARQMTEGQVAWFDNVPRISVRLARREKPGDDGETVVKESMEDLIPPNTWTAAGDEYRTPEVLGVQVQIAPGVEHVNLQMTREDPGTPGEAPCQEQRYSGGHTGHTLAPTDSQRRVRIQAITEPLAGESRIRIMEQHKGGGESPIRGRETVRWSDMSPDPGPSSSSIPELFVFERNDGGWNATEDTLREVAQDWRAKGALSPGVLTRLYDLLKVDGVLPLDSAGEPPGEGKVYEERRRVLSEAGDALEENFKERVREKGQARIRTANRWHMGATWLFTGCPSGVVDILMEAIREPGGTVATRLNLSNEFGRWPIYSGLGRAANTRAQMEMLARETLDQWEKARWPVPDICRLATISHPAARRAEMREIWIEDQDLFERTWEFLEQQLIGWKSTGWPRTMPGTPTLALRYIMMGYRGLCQIRYRRPDWLPTDHPRMYEAAEKMEAAQGRVKQKFVVELCERSIPFLYGEGEDPTIPRA